jgi:alpha-1,4-glucan:alpha-1,4-glucan 6-glycosyltransferase
VYLRYPHEELYAIACIESHRHDTVLLGEDLGTVAEGVRAAMRRHNVLRMHVFQGALWEGAANAFNLPAPAVASVNTHDMPPFAAFWKGSDIDVRHSLGLLAEERVAMEREQRVHLRRDIRNHLKRPPANGADDALDALLDCQRALAESSADIQLVSLEDLWLEQIPLNVPGTNEEHPNWKRRFPGSFEDIRGDETIRAALQEIDRLRRRGRPATTQEVTVASETPREIEPMSPPDLPELVDVRLSDVDLHLFNEGTHARMYQKFGAHVAKHESTPGTYFAVWAPNAANVSVIGDFNGWNSATSPLTLRGSSGVWDGFLRGIGVGFAYKYHVVGRSQFRGDKADPIGFQSEGAPNNASVVCTLDYTWNDDAWMSSRAERHRPDRPVSTYELHLGSWKRSPSGGHLTYRELADELIPYLTDLGYTHVELMPAMEHPFYGSWGYQITGYFAATHRYGSPQDLMALIDRLHQAGIGVLLDWVPSHFPTDGHGLAFFDGTHLYEHADPQKGFHPDWNSYIFNYGRHEVRSYLISNAMFWLDRFHIDGLRVDAVASMLYLDYSREEGEWVPNEHGGRDNLEAISLLKELNYHLHDAFPDTMQVAEESTAWPMVTGDLSSGGLGFAYKWDMGWMHDTLDYFEKDPVHRAHHHDRITFRGVYANTERFMLSLSHDEVVHGKRSLLSKMPGDWWQQFANLRLLFGYMYALPGKKLHFMGCELGVWNEWDHDDQLDWALADQPMHAAMQAWVRALNRLYREVPSLHDRDHHPEGFEWIDCHDREASVLTFARWSGDEANAPTLVVCNFTPVARSDFRVGVPREGTWELILNGDDESFGGGGVQPADSSAIASEPIEANGREHSLSLTLPPLATMFFRGPTRTAT